MPSSPKRFSFGTRTLSKASSAVSDNRIPTLSSFVLENEVDKCRDDVEKKVLEREKKDSGVLKTDINHYKGEVAHLKSENSRLQSENIHLRDQINISNEEKKKEAIRSNQTL